MLTNVLDPDPYVLPPLIKDLEHTKHIFTVHIAPGSRTGNTKFIIDNAANVPTPVLLETPTTPEATCASTTMLEQEDLATITEIPTAEITPPPVTDESIEKKDYQPEGSSNTARRQLFTPVDDQTDESDIRETETIVQEDQPMATGPPEETTDESKDKPSTHASKKPKHD